MDLMSFMSALLRTCGNKSLSRTTTFIFLALMLGLSLGTLYARLSVQPLAISKLDRRVSTLELSNAASCTQLADIDRSLNRIENSQEATRKDLSDLKNVFIKR